LLGIGFASFSYETLSNPVVFAIKYLTNIIALRGYINKTVLNRSTEISMTVHSMHNHEKLYRHMMVIGTGFLLAIIRSKKFGSVIARNHTNILLTTKINTSKMKHKIV
jgi:hypothetical protein